MQSEAAECSRIVPLHVLLSRAVYALAVPVRVFGQIHAQENPPWAPMLLLLFVGGFLHTASFPYLISGHWLAEMLPQDWTMVATGFGCFSLVEWLLVVFALLVVARMSGQTSRAIGPFGVAAFYIVVGIMLFPLLIDPFHRLFHIPLVGIHLPGFPVPDAPLAGQSVAYPLFGFGRLSYLVTFSWISILLWTCFRQFLQLHRLRELVMAGGLAIALPIMGRMVVEPCPILFAHFLPQLFHVSFRSGWLVF